jgi:hypothetical protein
MERYVEKKRERRRRDLERIVERMVVRVRRWWGRPGYFTCRGERIETWEDFHRASRAEARRAAGNLNHTHGGRYRGRNPRRLTGELKMSDIRAAHAAAEQLIEAAWSDRSSRSRPLR